MPNLWLLCCVMVQKNGYNNNNNDDNEDDGKYKHHSIVINKELSPLVNPFNPSSLYIRLIPDHEII